MQKNIHQKFDCVKDCHTSQFFFVSSKDFSSEAIAFYHDLGLLHNLIPKKLLWSFSL